MEIGKDEVIKILRANYNFEITETSLGPGIVMPAIDAFIFCNVTGAGYLENPLYPFSPKGLHKLFYNVFDYKFVTGIFDNSRLNHTPYLLSKIRSYLFKGDKIIIPVEFENEIQLQCILEDLYTTECNPENFVILRIEKRKKGNGMEGFMEYLAANYFKNLGYVVENQIPLTYSLGSPDFGGYKLVKTYSDLDDESIFNIKGFHLIELALLRLGIQKSININERIDLAIVGEAKTGTTNMSKQLSKYLDSGLFEFGFEIHPFKIKPALDSFGLFSINNKTLEIQFTPPKNIYVLPKDLYSKTKYYEWLNNYMKFYLIANLTNDELIDYYQKSTSKAKFNQEDLINFICKQTTDEIISHIICLL